MVYCGTWAYSEVLKNTLEESAAPDVFLFGSAVIIHNTPNDCSKLLRLNVLELDSSGQLGLSGLGRTMLFVINEHSTKSAH